MTALGSSWSSGRLDGSSILSGWCQDDTRIMSIICQDGAIQWCAYPQPSHPCLPCQQKHRRLFLEIEWARLYWWWYQDMTRLWLVDQGLYSTKLCEEDIHQLTAKKIVKYQNNHVIDGFPYMQKHHMFFPTKHILIWQYVPKLLIFDQQTIKFFPVT